MVIVNPKLSLPTDLPYKKRQRPFYSNTPLQQATIRYNEAIRKKYNDVQFAKRLENGSATQNETTGVNTIDIVKMVDPTLFSEMSNTSPSSMGKKRKSKPLTHVSDGDLLGTTSCRSRHISTCIENMKQLNTNSSAKDHEAFRKTNNSNNSNYDCNSTEMFPTLQATVNKEPEKSSNTTYNSNNAAAANNVKPPSTASLEAQAINEYEPTIDSAHDMIFGNVMGLEYGNYTHGPLWAQQPHQQHQLGCGATNGCEQQPQHFHTAPPSVCCSTKFTVGGYMQPPMHSVPPSPSPPPLLYDINSNMMNENAATINPLPGLGKHGGPPGRRSTSVPRPRTGTQKETLKQAAIRCGIIKGNHTVAAISKRSHCLVPLQLTPVQSDPVVSVVEILHPKGTIPACSSEALVDFEEFKFRTASSGSNYNEAFAIHNNKSTPALNIAMNMNAPGEGTNKPRLTTEKSNSDGHSTTPTDIRKLLPMLILSEPPTVQEMILGFIAGILNKYIGAYFEDIDVSQLTGSIFGGDVTLNNINLRPSIFESLGIPFHVVGGKCGQLEVKYSLTRLYSEPVVVTLKDLHVLIISARGVDFNEEAEQDAKQNEKMRQLDVFESVKHHILLTQERKANKAKLNTRARGSDEAILTTISSVIQNAPQEATYFDMWVMQVLRNIQFHIEGVHIRFEDDVTKPSEPFAVGLFLQSLQVHTTDQDWNSQYVKDYLPETSYKLVKVNGLSMYWNPSPTRLYKEIDEKEKLFEELAKTQKLNGKELHMFFEPLTMELKVQVTPFPDITREPFTKPKLLIETNFDEFKVNLSDKQFKDIIPFLETLEFLTKSHKYRKFRTGLHELSYKGHYKEWWQFAYNCILDDVQRRRNNFRWDHISDHRKKCHQYLKAYHKKKMESKADFELDLVLSNLEHELDLFMLIILRQHVELVLSHLNGPVPPTPEDNSYINWVTSWFSASYWFPQPPATPAAEPIPSEQRSEKRRIKNFSAAELTSDDKEIIRVAVGFAKNIDIVSYPNDYVALEANLLLNHFRARIYRSLGREQETVLDGLLEKVCFALRCRPATDGLEAEAKMGRVEVYGGDFPSEETASAGDTSGAPPLITTANPNVCEYFLKCMYEMNPLDSEVNQRVSLEGLALQFTYLADSINRIAECFVVPGSKRNDDVSKEKGNIPAARILRKVMQFRNSPTNKLLRMMDNKGKIEVNVCLIAPYLVIPQDSTISGKANFVVVNLGEINLVGTLVGGTICENGTCSHFL